MDRIFRWTPTPCWVTRLGALLARRLGALCAPTLRIGCSAHHLAFARTLSLRAETLRMIVHDVVDSLVRHGFRRVILLPTHAGNRGAARSGGRPVTA
jgi:creatinine amidohydrolase